MKGWPPLKLVWNSVWRSREGRGVQYLGRGDSCCNSGRWASTPFTRPCRPSPKSPTTWCLMTGTTVAFLCTMRMLSSMELPSKQKWVPVVYLFIPGTYFVLVCLVFLFMDWCLLILYSLKDDLTVPWWLSQFYTVVHWSPNLWYLRQVTSYFLKMEIPNTIYRNKQITLQSIITSKWD